MDGQVKTEGPAPAAGSSDTAGVELNLGEEMSFIALVWSDYRYHQADRPESALRSLVLMLPRYLFNPSLQLALLIRIGQKGPGILLHPVRWLQVVLFASEAYYFRGEERIRIGPALNLPHPTGVMIGPWSHIGSHVTLYNGVEIGSDRGGLPWELDRSRCSVIGDRVSVFPHSNVLGPFTIGHDSVVGLGVTVRQSLEPGSLMTKRTVKGPGEWDRSVVRTPAQSNQVGEG